MDDQTPVSAEAAIKAVPKTVDESVSTVVERQLTDQIRGLRAGLEMQIKAFPLAKLELVKLVGPWIDEAELALITFRETGALPAIGTDVSLARTKRRYWAELVVVQRAYSDMLSVEDVESLYDAMCVDFDRIYPLHLQRLADERRDHQDRMSGIRNATLERKLGEISEEQFIADTTEQL